MKQFIVLTAILPILMTFVMQTAYDQKNNRILSMIHDAVYVAKEQAKEEGSFTWEIQDRLRRNLSRVAHVSETEIAIFCREAGETLFYRVEVPIKDVVAGNKLFGISDNENKYIYVIDSYTIAGKAADVEEPDNIDVGNPEESDADEK